MNKITLKSMLTMFLLLCSITFGFSETKSAEEAPASAQQVKTGIYIMNIFDMDMAANSYYCDFYIWFRWKGDIDPVENLEFVNYVEKWGYMVTPLYDTTQVLSDGSSYMMMRVESRFYHPFLLERYPLDMQILDIQIENSEYASDELVYVADTEQSTFRKELQIPGWEILGITSHQNTNTYESDFGDIDDDSTVPYSNLTFELNIKRPITYFLWKLLLPLLLVIFAAIGAMLIFPGHIDARISLPIGSLLTAVFLQQSYTSSLPEIGYMVLMDKIYALSYIIIIIGLVETIITANWASSEEEDDYKRVRKLDIKFIIPLLAIFVIGVIYFVITS